MRRIATLTALLALATPALAVEMGDDGLHKPHWLQETFLDLAEDHAEATANGQSLMILIEQRGCSYCRKMHEEVFTDPRIETLLEEEFYVLQINMFGDLEVTDFDGTVLSEKDMTVHWGALFTPTMMIFPAEIPEDTTAARAAVATMPGAFSASTTLDLLTWVREEVYLTDEPFQKYHARMIEERQGG